MKNRILNEGFITTILGCLMIIFCGAMVWFDKASFEELSGWFGVAVLFIRSKDSLIGIGEKNIKIDE